MTYTKFSLLLSFTLFLSTVMLPSQAEGLSPAYNVRGIKIELIGAKKKQVRYHAARSQQVVNQALNLAGTRYHFGGNTPNTGFDCSGFVQYVYQQAAAVALPRTAAQMSSQGTYIEKIALKRGDLVFFKTTKKPNSHVGIYIGGNKIIHAPRTGRSVSIEDINSPYWAKRYNGARRIN